VARAVLGAGRDVLHLGAGRDSYAVVSRLRRSDLRVTSVDVDREGLVRNPNRTRVVADAGRLPFRESAFDLILSEDVFEHLADPGRVLGECHRCLRPGGALVFLCPNRWSYISLLSRMTPHRLHRAFKQSRMGVASRDVFPTYYRLNTAGRIRRLASQAGLVVERVTSDVGWPTYWEFSDLLHAIFCVVHRVLAALPSACHITLVGVLRRPPARREPVPLGRAIPHGGRMCPP
jgi:SAM-dependent methyltransferase